jgi:hypothetical protein
MWRRVDRDRPPDIEAEAIVERDRQPEEKRFGSSPRVVRNWRRTGWAEVWVADEVAEKMPEDEFEDG